MNLKRLFFGILFISAVVLAYWAGKEGIDSSKKESPRLFRPLPILRTEGLKDAIITEDKTEDQAKKEQSQIPEIEKKDSPESSAENKSEEKKDDTRNPKSTNKTVEKESFLNFDISLQDFSLGGRRESFILSSGRMGSQVRGESQRNTSRREKNIPSFSDVYVPLYGGLHLTPKTKGAFLNKFSSQSFDTLIYLLNRLIDDAKYEILVFDSEGKNFLGTFETLYTDGFPFLGIPTFMRVDPKNFKEVSRFFVFTESYDALSYILTDETHLKEILNSAYRSSLGVPFGVDPKFGFSLYLLFPNIYLAAYLG